MASSLLAQKIRPNEKNQNGVPANRCVAILKVTNDCNLQCKYCYSTNNHAYMGEEVAYRAIDFIFGLGYSHVMLLFHGGEPLLFGIDKIQRISEYAKKQAKAYNKSVSFLIQTNGTLITNEVAKFLMGSGFRVGVSMDGLPAVHDSMRTSFSDGSFDVTLNGVKNLQKHHWDGSVITVVSKLNFRQIPETIQFLDNLGIGSVKLNPVEPIINSGGVHQISITPEEFLASIKDATSYAFNHYKDTHHIAVTTVDILINAFLKGSSPYFCLGRPCSAGRSVFCFDVNGDIYPCDSFIGIEGYKMGNVIRNRPTDIQPFSVGLMENGAYGDENCMKDSCANCEYKDICYSCPFLSGRLMNNSANSRYFCEFNKMFYSYLEENSKRIDLIHPELIKVKEDLWDAWGRGR